jgi:hypothetical protein
MAKTLEPHQERVVQEKRELDERLAKLTSFMDGPIYPTIDRDERFRIMHQRYVMREYSDVLGYRIAAFGGSNG